MMLRVSAWSASGDVAEAFAPLDRYIFIGSFTVAGALSSKVAPRLFGVAAIGETLEATEGQWWGSPTTQFTFQWQRCSDGTCTNIAGAQASTYVVGEDDLGTTLHAVVTAHDGTQAASAPTVDSAEVVESGNNVSDPLITHEAAADDEPLNDSATPLDPANDPASVVPPDEDGASGAPLPSVTTDVTVVRNTVGATFTNNHGKWTVYWACTIDSAGNPLGPGFISRFVDKTGRVLVDDRRSAVLGTGSIAGLNALKGGLGTFGFHEVIAPIGSDSTPSVAHVNDGRFCASTNTINGMFGVYPGPSGSYANNVLRGPTRITVNGQKVGVLDVDVWFRDAFGATSAPDGVGLVRVRYRWRFYSDEVDLWLLVTTFASSAGGSNERFIKEPKLSAALRGVGTNPTIRFTRMAVMSGAGTFIGGKMRGGLPGSSPVGTVHETDDSRVSVRWDYGTSLTNPDGGCAPTNPPCFSAVMRGYPATGSGATADVVPGQQPGVWEKSGLGLDQWAVDLGGPCQPLRTFPCLKEEDTFAGDTPKTDCVPLDGDTETPYPENEKIRRWEFAGRKDHWVAPRNKYNNSNPFRLSTALFHAWEGGTGAYDCEPLYRRMQYGAGATNYAVYASFVLGPLFEL